MIHPFRLLAILAIVALVMLFPSSAKGDSGYWRVTGTVVNIDNEISPLRCEKPGVKLRFRSRWANGEGCAVGFEGECPWGPSWGETSTGNQGQFSVQSNWLANDSRKRDILIEAQKMGSWFALKIVPDISGATPHATQGNISIFDIGTVETDAFDCPFEPNTPQRTQPTVQPVETTGGGGGGGVNQDGQFEPLRCGLGHNGKSNIDLEIVASEIRQRDGRPDAARELVTWEVAVRNNGSGTYLGSGNCLTRVEVVFSTSELSSDRDYDVDLEGEIGPGQTRTFTTTGNFGPASPASLNSYNVLFTVDPDNKIVETNEQNNQQPGCYTLATQTYVDSPCTAAQVRSPQNQRSEKSKRKSPSARKTTGTSRKVIRNRFINRKN